MILQIGSIGNISVTWMSVLLESKQTKISNFLKNILSFVD